MLELFFYFQDVFFTLFIVGIRLKSFFTLFPVLGKGVVNGTIRNVIMIAFGMVLIPPLLSKVAPLKEINLWILLFIVTKEAFIGAVIGFVAGMPFWSVEGVGFLIDNQRGSSMASMMNVTTGGQTTPLGVFFSQIFIVLFFCGGGFLLVLHVLYNSYLIWPIEAFFPRISALLPLFFLRSLDQIYILIVVLGAPIVICLFFTEFGLGMMNRFAQQLNVFSLAMPVKSGVGALIIIIYLRFLLHYFEEEIIKLRYVLDILKPIIT